MSKSTMNKIYRSFFSLIFCLLIFTAIYGCGTGPDKAAGTGTTPTTIDLSSITLSVSSSSVTFGTPVTVTATVRDSNGALVSTNTVVTFAADSSLVAFNPASATALTSGGVASIILNAADISSAGATNITASASVTTSGTSATVISTPVGISVGSVAVTLGAITLGQPSISAYGTSSVSVPVLIGGSPATVPISVAFTSPCASLSVPKATLTTPVTSNIVTGTATSTYADNNCASGTDTITASVTGAIPASTLITVAIPATNNIKFISATPTTIGIKGSTLPQSSLVKFQVVDSHNDGKGGVSVDFSLKPVSAPGGITLSAASAISDTDGYVTTSVNSGTVPTPIWVVAKVNGSGTPGITTQSNTLTIITGQPTQDFFSLAVETYNIEGWNNNGETSTLTIIASDRLGNPIPDGTAINFITEGGTISGSCSTTSGTCTVTFTSSDSRPTNGRVTILAYAVGEKSFIASSPNNIYTLGDTFYDLGDLYIDANENGIWDTGETHIVTGSGTLSCLTRPAATALPLSYANAPSKDNTCDNTWGTNYVRRSTVIVLSGNSALIPTLHTVTMGSTCTKSFNLALTDVNGNPLPAGTTVATANNEVYYIVNGGGTTQTAATVSITYGTPVLNTNALGGTAFTLKVKADCTAGTPVAYPAGTLDIKTTTPKGIITGIPITVN